MDMARVEVLERLVGTESKYCYVTTYGSDYKVKWAITIRILKGWFIGERKLIHHNIDNSYEKIWDVLLLKFEGIGERKQFFFPHIFFGMLEQLGKINMTVRNIFENLFGC